MLDRDMDDWTDLVKPEMLTRRLTLDEYFVEHVEWVRNGQITQAAVDQDRAQLEARWQPGDGSAGRGACPHFCL